MIDVVVEKKEMTQPDFPLSTRACFVSNKDSLGVAPSQPPAHTISPATIMSHQFPSLLVSIVTTFSKDSCVSSRSSCVWTPDQEA